MCKPSSQDLDSDESVRVAFVCVRNAGRSQIAAAFAEREIRRRGKEDQVEIATGGTRPAEKIHDVVVEAMEKEEFDLSRRTPREISIKELESFDLVATMGCSSLDLNELDGSVELRVWNVNDPGGESLDRVMEIRDEIETRVSSLLDEL
ncbi:MAG: low molecular weight phosphatase family protein [Halobacteria archaeon]